MPGTLRSILCGQTWNQDSAGECTIKFAENGDGELVCRREIPIYIAAEIRWNVLGDPSLLDRAISGDDEGDMAGPINLEITLTRRRSSWVSAKPRINEQLLEDAAFAPKTYTVRVERGAFYSPRDLATRETIPRGVPKYAFRLTFDKSPYPPRDQWRSAGGAPDALKFWEWTEFVRGKLPKSDEEQG